MKTLIPRILLLGFTPIFFVCISCSQAPPENFAGEALTLAKAGGKANWEMSCQKLETCIKGGNKQINLVTLYILSLDKIGNREKATSLALRSLKRQPNNFVLNYFLGASACKNGEFRTALRYLGKCHNLRDKHVGTLVLMLRCAEEINLNYAETLYQKLLNLTPAEDSFLLHNGLAVCHTRNGNPSRAMSEFSKALRLSNGHPSVYLNMAILCDHYMNKPELAKRYYLDYLQKVGDKPSQKSEEVTRRLKKVEEN